MPSTPPPLRSFPLAPHPDFHPPKEQGEVEVDGGEWARASLLKTAWIQGGAEREGDRGKGGGRSLLL